MIYQNFKTLANLQQTIENDKVITGEFLCEYDPEAFYGIPCEDKIFKDCIIVKGSFLSTNFIRCIFENVVFRETEFITRFTDCEFIDCIFSNVDSGFTMENTKIIRLSQFFEEEKEMIHHIEKMKERTSK